MWTLQLAGRVMAPPRSASVPGYAGHRPGAQCETEAVGKTFAKVDTKQRFHARSPGTTPRVSRAATWGRAQQGMDVSLERVRMTSRGAAHGGVAVEGYRGHVPGAKNIVGCSGAKGNKQAVQAFGCAPDRANRETSKHPLKDGSATTRTHAVPGYMGCIPGKQDESVGVGWTKAKKRAGDVTRRTHHTARAVGAPVHHVKSAVPKFAPTPRSEVTADTTPMTTAREEEGQHASTPTPRYGSGAAQSALQSALRSSKSESCLTKSLRSGESDGAPRTPPHRAAPHGAATPPPQTPERGRKQMPPMEAGCGLADLAFE